MENPVLPLLEDALATGALSSTAPSSEANHSAFGSSLESVARGILALAKTDPESEFVRLLGISRRQFFPGVQSFSQGGEMIVAFNPVIPGCGCSQPAGSYVFGRGGTLRLQAVVLLFGESYRTNVQMSLVFPYPTAIPGDSQHGFATVNITPDGHTIGEAVGLSLYPNQTLKYSLGLVETEELFGVPSMMSGINAALNFPGADEYLAKHIGDLGPYLEAAAAKLAGQHVH